MSMKLSCIDCAVKNCDKMDKSFPEFCLTTNMDTEVLNKDLKVMDATAISLCRENKLPIVVFNSLEEGNIKKVIMGEKIGTVVVAD